MPTICAHCNTPESVCHSYALMKEPANWRSFLSGRTWMGPSGGHRLFVGDNPRYNWQSLAALDGWTARELIYFNFRTNDPKEINWYLYHFAGCRYSPDGRRNLSFHYARPGIIFTRHPHSTSIPKVGPGYVPLTVSPIVGF